MWGCRSLDQRQARDEFFLRRRGVDLGVPEHGYHAAVEQMRAAEEVLRSNSAQSATPLSWQFIGPQPMMGNLPNFGGAITGPAIANSTGRITAIAVDPQTPGPPGRVFVGEANGGVWMTTDGGTTFKPIFDNGCVNPTTHVAGACPTLAIGAIALDPNTTPTTIYVATGEGHNSADSYYGQGIFRSKDLGTSWTQLAPGTFDRMAFTRLAIDSNQLIRWTRCSAHPTAKPTSGCSSPPMEPNIGQRSLSPAHA